MIIAECKPNLNTTKIHDEEGTRNYDDAALFKFTKVGVKSFKSLCYHLESLEKEPKKFIIRGDSDDIKEGYNNRRKLTVNGGTVYPVERQWALFDFDGVGEEWGPWVSEALHDPEGMVKRFLVEKCPPELRDASVYWQYGSNMGIKENKFSLHLWVWLSEPVMNLKPYYIEHGFDGLLAGAVQVHYTAAPVFEDGREDPMPIRSGVLERGGAMDAGPILALQDTVPAMGGEKLVMAEKTHQAIRNEIEEADASEGERHDTALRLSLGAIANGMDHDEVATLMEDKLVEWGYDASTAKVDAKNMVKGAQDMKDRGRVEVDDASHAFSSVGEEVKLEPEAVVEQQKALTEPSFLETIETVDDKLKFISENQEKFGKLTEFEFMDLENILRDDGVVVDGRAARGQLTPGKLNKLRKEAAKASGGSGVVVDPQEVERYQDTWKRTYVSEDQKGYYLYSKSDRTMRPLSKRDELDVMCKYLCASLTREGQLLFQEKFYKEIHEERMIGEWIGESKPFGKSEVKFEQRGDGKLNVVVQSSVMEYLKVVKERFDDVEVPEEFERWLDKDYGIVSEIMRAVLARRFLGNKKSTIWVNCSSDWGKTFFFGVGQFGLVMENNYSSENFKGNDAAQMARYLYVFVDEADRFTKEMKQDVLSYRKIYSGLSSITLPARILASANPIGDLSDGVDQQLLNRVVKIKVEAEPLKKVLKSRGWGTDKARRWYEAVLSRKLLGWLEDWEVAADPLDEMANVYEAFSTRNTIDDAEEIEEMIRGMFWNHFLFDHIRKDSTGKFRKKTNQTDGSTAWAADFLWVDNGSEKDPERRRLYVKKISAWADAWTHRDFGEKKHAVKKSLSSVQSIVRILSGVKCERLPDQKKFKGMYFDISGLKEVEGG